MIGCAWLRMIAVTVLTTLLVACSGAGDGTAAGLSATERKQAAEVLRSYELARKENNWQAAEAYADRLQHKFPDSAAAATAASSIAQVREHADQEREHKRLLALWDYQAIAVGKGVQRSAAIQSRTVAVEEGEPLPNPDAQLVLRDHPSWGRSAYLLLAQSRFNCGTPCAMQISFDGGAAQRFAGKQADSGKGPALFIEDKERFISALASARQVRIELPKGSGTLPAMVFEVAGYQPKRFEKP